MEAERTIPELNIPSSLSLHRVESITFLPNDKIVRVRCFDENDVIQDLEADVSDLWTNLSVTKKTDWKLMFKKIVALALAVTSGDITGDIWD